MGDNDGRVGKQLAARNVIGMVVAVDQVLHRLRKAFSQLGLEPARRVGVDGIGCDNPGGSDQKYGEVVGVSKTVKVALDLDNFPPRRRLRQRRGGPEKKRRQPPRSEERRVGKE